MQKNNAFELSLYQVESLIKRTRKPRTVREKNHLNRLHQLRAALRYKRNSKAVYRGGEWYIETYDDRAARKQQKAGILSRQIQAALARQSG